MAQPDPRKERDPRIHVSVDQLRRLSHGARALSLLPRQPANSILNGRHGSRLRGRGLNFEELRGYLQGDDIRSIDWKVTARTGEPHVRVYTEERDRPALVVVDQRMSMFFGSQVYMKSVVAAEAATIVAHRILGQGDRIGGLVFGDTIVAEHPPQRRALALNQLISSIAQANDLLNPTQTAPVEPIHLNTLLKRTVRIVKTNTLVALFSDFEGLNDESEKYLRKLALANDLIVFNVFDPASRGLPASLRLAISDGSQQADLDTSDPAVRERINTALKNRLGILHAWSRKYGFPVVPLETNSPALDQILTLFGHTGGRK
jgi:uncharacterized protein (DUF58 family)